MYSVQESAAASYTEGGYEPRWMDVSLQSMTFYPAEGEAFLATVEDEILDFRIINRSQIILETPLKDYTDVTFTSFSLDFAADAVIEGKLGSHELTLASPILTYEGEVQVETGKELLVAIRVLWKNLVSLDSETGEEVAAQPDFSIVLDR
jgi:hypothetical protein